MGLSMSDAIRLLMLRVADERRLPFDIKMPNSASHQAVTVHNAHNGKRSARIEASAANRHPAD